MEQKLVNALRTVLAIVDDSEGVAGYHLNGEIAEWGEFEEIGNIEDLVSEWETLQAENGKLHKHIVSGSALCLCEKCGGFSHTMDGKKCTNCGHYR